MKISIFIICSILPLIVSCTETKNYPEKHFQDEWCQEHGGTTKNILEDGTKPDCITETHAVEFEFAGHKWYESGFQSLHYAMLSGKRAGVVMILKKSEDEKYWQRLNTLIDFYGMPIDTWRINQ